jgi:hypothetical protein
MPSITLIFSTGLCQLAAEFAESFRVSSFQFGPEIQIFEFSLYFNKSCSLERQEAMDGSIPFMKNGCQFLAEIASLFDIPTDILKTALSSLDIKKKKISRYRTS